MTSSRRNEWLEVATKLIVISILLWPFIPNAPRRWFYIHKTLRYLAREIGSAALTAEARYYQSLEEL